MDPTKGRPGKVARLEIGALLIKHKLNMSDEEKYRRFKQTIFVNTLLASMAIRKRVGETFSYRSQFIE